MLRGAEFSSALATALTIDTTEQRETLLLPKSKTDKQAVGCRRTWGCVCPNTCLGEDALCPYAAACAIKHELSRRFGIDGGHLPPDLPLFPTASGEPCTRDGYVATVAAFADALQLNIFDALGRNTIGEHVWRVSGSRLLARAGVPLTQIALMARWGSDIILRNVAETPLDTITENFAQASQSLPVDRKMITAVAGQLDMDNLQDDLTLNCDDVAL